ncbi:AAA family ATPase [Aquimarina rhabdastrellae]
MKIVIFGASGSGTTTLAQTLSQKLNWKHLDADAYYWKKTDPPFQEKLPLEERNENLKSDFNAFDDVVISGSLVTWSTYWNTAFDLGIFLRLPKPIRMQRLRNRESELYGEELETNQEIQIKSEKFLEWAEKYDDETFDGRSIRQHRDWIKEMTCEVVEINKDLTNNERVKIVLDKIAILK